MDSGGGYGGRRSVAARKVAGGGEEASRTAHWEQSGERAWSATARTLMWAK